MWKKKNSDLEGGLSRMAFLEKDKKMFEDKFNNQIKNIEELKFTITKLSGDNDVLRKSEQKCRDMEMKNDAFAKELERLNLIIRNKEQ